MRFGALRRPLKLLTVGALAAATVALPRWVLSWRSTGRIYSARSVPFRPTAIVFGAGLRHDGSPTLVLADRVATAVSLYRDGKVQKLLLSGSTSSSGHNEPAAMRKLALRLGVPPEDILLDTGGTRTYETCWRARSRFGVGQALLITQRFHLPRALAICDALGIDALGVASDLHQYSLASRLVWEMREIPASLFTLLETSIPRARLVRALPGTARHASSEGESHAP